MDHVSALGRVVCAALPRRAKSSGNLTVCILLAEWAGLLVVAVLLTGCGGRRESNVSASTARPTAGRAVVVFAAASTTNALDEIKSEAARRIGVEIRTSYAASSALAQQIVHGAEADLFISADEKWADFVAKQSPVARRCNLLSNRLVMVTPAESRLALTKPEDLLAKEIGHLALGDPDAVPVGRYAKQALSKLGLWEKLQGKVVPAEDVRQVLMYVETGAAEAGIVYATDAAVSQRAKVAAVLPDGLSDPVRYPLLLLDRGAGNKAAVEFFEYLRSAEAAQRFEHFGFIVLIKGRAEPTPAVSNQGP